MVWWRRRRIRALEDAVSLARAEQAELRRRLELFEQIARAAGASLPEITTSSNAVPAAPLPASLVAAAREHSPRQVPVRLDVDGTAVIAVIWGPGDPREWWSAIRIIIDDRGRSVIRLGRLPLPAGLSAVVWPGRKDDLVVVVSDALDAAQQREAVRVALRAARRHDGRLGLLPLPAAFLLSPVRHAVISLVRLLRLHAFASAVAGIAGAAAVTAAVIVLAPHGPVHGNASGAAKPPSYQQRPTSRQSAAAQSRHDAVGRSGQAPRSRQTAPGAVAVASQGTGPVPSTLPSISIPPRPSPSPAPIPSSTAPVPSPTPSPTPTTSSPSPEPTICVEILGVKVCI